MVFSRIRDSIKDLEQHKMSDEQLMKYNDSMSKSMIDKLFFLKQVYDYNFVVDFGCADGTLLAELTRYDKDATYVGYDISDQMLSVARKKCPDNVILTSSWDKVLELKAQTKGNSLMIMNSVLHEVFSYSSESELEHFWEQAFQSDFDYISIRDMMMRKTDFDVKLDDEKIATIKETLIAADHGEEKVSSFESIYGPIKTEGSLIHLLMKWNWWHNWKREVHENYLGIFLEDFVHKLDTVGKGKYAMKYYNTFALQHLKDFVKELIGYDIEVPTHIKLILSKRK
jgi:SAM-dependent methyltransferase